MPFYGAAAGATSALGLGAEVVRDALAEDAGLHGDVTTQATVPDGVQAVGTFLAKSTGVLAGLAVVDLVFQTVDPSLEVTWSARDGDRVEPGTRFGHVQGAAASILVAERVALNLLQRMSGIATATAALVAAAAGTRAKILDTRKTAPGLRLLDKWAVVIGGGVAHRMGLFDMMMIKDNHVTAAGGIAPAIAAAESWIADRPTLPATPGIEVETRTLEEVREVLTELRAGRAPHVVRVMLDNMARPDPDNPAGVDVALLAEAVQVVGDAVDTEASGNVSLRTVPAIAATGVNYISVGSITHSVTAQDISLKIQLLDAAA